MRWRSFLSAAFTTTTTSTTNTPRFTTPTTIPTTSTTIGTIATKAVSTTIITNPLFLLSSSLSSPLTSTRGTAAATTKATTTVLNMSSGGGSSSSSEYTYPSKNPNEENELIREILTNCKTIVLIGASNKSVRPSNRVMKYLLNLGYTVIPVNPGLENQLIHDQLVYKDLHSLPKDIVSQIDMIDIFRNSDAVTSIVDDAIETMGTFLLDSDTTKPPSPELKPTIWTQLDVINVDAAQKAQNAGFHVIMNKCPAIEIPKLNITPKVSTAETKPKL